MKDHTVNGGRGYSPAIISSITEYDKKRLRLVLDDGEDELLLYKGEFRGLGLSAGDTLEPEVHEHIVTDILIPRAKKRLLYYLKAGDKSEAEVRRKLKEGLYPDEAIEAALAFSEKYSFTDDARLTENMIESGRGRYSAKELYVKLARKGIKKELIKEKLDELTDKEDEYASCLKLLKKYLPKNCPLYGSSTGDTDDTYGVGDEAADFAGTDEDKTASGRRREIYALRQKAYAYLMRHGYSSDAVEYAFNHISD